MAATDVSVLASTQESWITDQVTSSFFDSTDVCMKILNSSGRNKIDGGEKAAWTFESADVGAGTGKTITGAVSQTYNVVSSEFLRKAELDWTFYGLSYKRSKADFDILNKGAARVINLAMAALDNLKESMKLQKIGCERVF